MADEIKVTAKLSFSKSGSSDEIGGSFTDDMSGSDWIHVIQDIGSSAMEAIQSPQVVGTPNWLCIKNKDASINVTLGFLQTDLVTYTGGIILAPGEWNVFKVSNVGLVGLKANSSSVKVEFLLLSA